MYSQNVTPYCKFDYENAFKPRWKSYLGLFSSHKQEPVKDDGDSEYYLKDLGGIYCEAFYIFMIILFLFFIFIFMSSNVLIDIHIDMTKKA